jgi:nucleoside-diphosphate-sugar epimerase
MTRVLVTGGAGFIGLHLASNLVARGMQVDLLDNFSRGALDADVQALAAKPGVRLMQEDLLAPGALRDLGDDYEYIFHLAAIIGVANVQSRPLAVLRDNQKMLFTVLDLAARQRALTRFVFASTSEVVVGTLEANRLLIPTPESTELVLPDLARPRTSYMLSKLYGEAICMHSGLPFTALRPHNVYGPRMGMAHVIPELLARASRAPEGGRLEVYSAEHTRTFCYVDDAVEILIRAATSPGAAGQVLNLGAQEPEVTMREVAVEVCRAVGRDLEIVPLPAAAGSPSRRCPDMTKTTRIIDYVARISLPDGIRRTLAWYAARGFPAEKRA